MLLRVAPCLALIALLGCPSGDSDDDDTPAPVCGDGVVEGTEECDDGNTANGDGCNEDCLDEVVCGDSVVEGTEECDDGNTTNGDGCDENCETEPVCGDGAREDPPEKCDDGNTTPGDGCDDGCGIEVGWACAGETPDVCAPICGDGMFIAPEECDDGNTTPGDGCGDMCTVESGYVCTSTGTGQSECMTVCGDGLIRGTEECDDGNPNGGDGCSADCVVEDGYECALEPSICDPICGDGIPRPPEDCDDANLINGDGCDNNCTTTGCGNGIRTAGEDCDDGNLMDGDGCTSFCIAEYTCGDGNEEPGEECDDGNLLPRDGCDPTCQIELCGNGAMDPGEACDDGNYVDGDGCSSACLVDTLTADYVSSGYGGMRGIGSGELTVAGVGTGTVTAAILYYHGPTNVNDPTANALINFAGTQIVGTNIGFSDNNCWNFDNSQAYRADVTSLVAGDGTYAIDGLVKPGVDINGASLLVLFDDGDPTNDLAIFLFDGNDSNVDNPFDAEMWDQVYPGIVRTTTTATITLELHVSDGQVAFVDDAVFLNGIELLPANAQNFAGTSVPAGAAAEGGLWDILAFPVSTYMVGTNTASITSGALIDDCLSLIAAVFLVEE